MVIAAALSWWEAILLGIVEGVTEFLPVSSTGHLTIVEKLLGMQIDDPGVVAFTAVIQIGAIAAAVIYFWSDILRIAIAWLKGLTGAEARKNPDYTFGWGVILGSIPIAIVGLVFKDTIETGLRSLYWVAAGLILWSAALWVADRVALPAAKAKPESQLRLRDALAIGITQCLALIPGVSRSGATITAGLVLGYDRVVATRLSFFLGIPALVAAGALEAATQASNISGSVGWMPTIIGLAVSFVVGYASIAWLLKFVSRHTFTAFITYRTVLGAGILVALWGGYLAAV